MSQLEHGGANTPHSASFARIGTLSLFANSSQPWLSSTFSFCCNGLSVRVWFLHNNYLNHPFEVKYLKDSFLLESQMLSCEVNLKTMKTSRFSNCKVLGLAKSVLSCSVNHGKNTWQRPLQPQRDEDCEIDLSATRDTSNELQLGGIMQQVDRVKSNYLKPDKLPFQRTPFFLPR